MKICFIAPANSSHIVKWCTWFNNHGHKTFVISFTPGKIEGTKVYLVDVGVDVDGNDFEKIRYLFAGKTIKKIVKKIQPDVVNVHYATSYGITVALSGLKKYILSVWGSDIYDFPNKSFIHRLLLKFSLKRASMLFSTSKAMAKEARKYTNKTFEITPFGVDMELFNTNKRNRLSDDKYIVGTIKTLSDLYGIDLIIKAVASIRKKHPEIDVIARISGDGPQEKKYKGIISKMNLEDSVILCGKISQDEAAKEWANMDVAVIPSVRYESFGVAAIEAQASGIPVIISDVGGLMETTVPGQTSIVVPKMDVRAIETAIVELYKSPELRKKMGDKGRKNVEKKYEINRCFEQIEKKLLDFKNETDRR